MSVVDFAHARLAQAQASARESAEEPDITKLWGARSASVGGDAGQWWAEFAFLDGSRMQLVCRSRRHAEAVVDAFGAAERSA